jgi:hypothetical protein
LFINKQVIWLDIPVHNVLGMDVAHDGAQLVHDQADRFFVHAAGLRLKQLKQVAGDKLHDNEQAVSDVELIYQADNVGVLKGDAKMSGERDKGQCTTCSLEWESHTCRALRRATSRLLFRFTSSASGSPSCGNKKNGDQFMVDVILT